MREELSLEELLRKHESSLTKSLKLRLSMESCRRRRHNPRCCCSTQKKRESGNTSTQQTPKKPRHQTPTDCDRQTWVLWSGSKTIRPETLTGCWRSEEQSRRMFSRSNTKKGTKVTEVQINSSSAEIAFISRSNLQSLQSPTPPHFKKDTPET